MPRSSHSSKASGTTIRTVDDVFERLSIYEEQHGEVSLEDARQYVSGVCLDDNKLSRDTIKSLESPGIFFGVLCADSKMLLKLMHRTNTVLGGIQATAFFHPIAHLTAAPWDFYCNMSNGSPDEFIMTFGQITMFSRLEDVKSDTGERVVYYRGNVNGTNNPVNIRVFIANRDNMQSVLDLKYSYQQSMISAVGAVCFWPRLMTHKQFRMFKSNGGQSYYPSGKTICPSHIKRPREVKQRTQSTVPSIYTGEDKRIDMVVFENEASISKQDYEKSLANIRGMVYSVFNSSTKYLGTVGDMK